VIYRNDASCGKYTTALPKILREVIHQMMSNRQMSYRAASFFKDLKGKSVKKVVINIRPGHHELFIYKTKSKKDGVNLMGLSL
jgi:hypothetical protein